MERSQISLNRRRILQGAGALSAASLVGLPAIAQARPKITFMEPSDLALEFMTEMNGVVGGHFEKEGVDVDVTFTRGTSVAIQQVAAGQAHMSRVGLHDVLKATAAQDIPLLSVGTSLHQPIFILVSRKADPIKSVEDMKGKTIGVGTLGGGQDNILNLMIAAGGLNPADVPRQAIGVSAGSVELLKSGRIAAFFTTPEGMILYEREKEPVEMWSAGRYAPVPGGVIITTRGFAEKNADACAKFWRGMRASAMELIKGDPNKILDRVEAKYEISANKDRAFRVAAIKAYNEMMLAQGEANVMRNVPEIWTKSADLMAKAGIAKVANVDALWTNKFADAKS